MVFQAGRAASGRGQTRIEQPERTSVGQMLATDLNALHRLMQRGERRVDLRKLCFQALLVRDAPHLLDTSTKLLGAFDGGINVL